MIQWKGVAELRSAGTDGASVPTWVVVELEFNGCVYRLRVGQLLGR